MKLLLKSLGVVALITVVIFLNLLWVYRDIPAATLENKYATAPSKFIEIDGIRYHVRQEGVGPDVVLLHASFGNLFMWDEWVKSLSGQYRITRLDLVAHGLTGGGTAESYSTDELEESLGGLLEELELDDFHLVGTSLGGILAFTYAAENIDKVRSLTLINSAGLLHKTVNPNPVQKSIPLKIRLFSLITPRHLIDNIVTDLIKVEDKITPEVLQTYYDMLMREGNRKATLAGMANYKTRDPSPWLKKITAPTFVIWSDGSVLPEEEAEEFIGLLEKAPTQTMLIKGGGHALPLSHPVETSTSTADFWRRVDQGEFVEGEG